jgi:cytochrome c553
MKPLILLFVFLLVISCQQSKKTTYSTYQLKTETHPGKTLLEEKCNVCHSPSASHDKRLAPPMIAIKKHYISGNTSKEAFTEAMQNWIKNPNEANAKMYGAVNKFGIMPKLQFSEETINQISDYMFDHEIEQPEWFEEHFNEQQGKLNRKQNQQSSVSFESLPYTERGMKYALTTKAILGKNLMGKIQESGTEEALTFCNEKAYFLTDSMSRVHNTNIKRVSDKPRNVNNRASKKETEYIETFKRDILKNIESEPILEESDAFVNVYYPIKTNAMCLQCHGKPKTDIKPQTLAKIKDLYPRDKAIGYSANEVRGIWRVSIKK